MKKLNGFNNGRDTTAGIGGNKPFNEDMELNFKKMEKESFQEAINNVVKELSKNNTNNLDDIITYTFKAGAKWQSQQGQWSDDDLKEAFEQGRDYELDKHKYNDFETWLQQYKLKKK